MSDFARKVIVWQQAHGRHGLPWQQTRDPYRIWLSEIMLQQTQVATVLPYYLRFLEVFPDVHRLAASPVERVLELWAGLGYYARARNLHACAQRVMTQFKGEFPTTAADLLSLPGIGRSTAAAIAAFSSGERAAILDGNVKRVLSRYFALEDVPGLAATERRLWALADGLLPEGEMAGHMAAYTQGLMDLGATVCTRSNPRCKECPLGGECVARASARQDELPRSKPGRVLKERVITYTLVLDRGAVLLERRAPSGIWGGLLVPPEGEPGVVAARLGWALTQGEPQPELRHAFTHFRLLLRPVLCRPVTRPWAVQSPDWVWLDLGQVEDAALPTPIRKLLRELARPGQG